MNIQDYLKTFSFKKLQELSRKHNKEEHIKLRQTKDELIKSLSKLYKTYTNTYLVPYNKNLYIDKQYNITNKKLITNDKQKDFISKLENKQIDNNNYLDEFIKFYKPNSMLNFENFVKEYENSTDNDDVKNRTFYIKWIKENIFIPSLQSCDDKLFMYRIKKLNKEIEDIKHDTDIYKSIRRHYTNDDNTNLNNKRIEKLQTFINDNIRERNSITDEDIFKKEQKLIEDIKKTRTLRKIFLAKTLKQFNSKDTKYLEYLKQYIIRKYPMNYNLYTQIHQLSMKYNEGIPIWILENDIEKKYK